MFMYNHVLQKLEKKVITFNFYANVSKSSLYLVVHRGLINEVSNDYNFIIILITREVASYIKSEYMIPFFISIPLHLGPVLLGVNIHILPPLHFNSL